MRLPTFFRSLIPGVSRIHHGTPIRGILIFLLFTLLLNGFLIAPLLTSGGALRIGLLVAALATWALAFYDGFRIAAPGTSAAAPERERERVYDGP